MSTLLGRYVKSIMDGPVPYIIPVSNRHVNVVTGILGKMKNYVDGFDGVVATLHLDNGPSPPVKGWIEILPESVTIGNLRRAKNVYNELNTEYGGLADCLSSQ